MCFSRVPVKIVALVELDGTKSDFAFQHVDLLTAWMVVIWRRRAGVEFQHERWRTLSCLVKAQYSYIDPGRVNSVLYKGHPLRVGPSCNDWFHALGSCRLFNEKSQI